MIIEKQKEIQTTITEYYEVCDLCGSENKYEDSYNGKLPIGMYDILPYYHDVGDKKRICKICYDKLFPKNDKS